MESQWKLRQQHDQNFSKEGKPLQNKTCIRGKINSIEQNFESHSLGFK